MTRDLQINAFQRRLEALLNKELASLGLHTHNRQVEYGEFGYIHAYVFGRNAEFWIYQDEAEFAMGSREMRAEAPDYENEEDLIQKFVAVFIDTLSRNKHGQACATWTGTE